jgi:hypothetical protein
LTALKDLAEKFCDGQRRWLFGAVFMTKGRLSCFPSGMLALRAREYLSP